jgi:hypothetical protein
MSMPGFTAESSLYGATARYQITSSFDPNGLIWPQACDLTCLGSCIDEDCAGLTGRERIECIKLCRITCGCTPPPPPPCTCTKTKCCQGQCSTVPIAC